MQPLVTFSICTYNRAFILKECLESVIKEIGSSNDVELLIIDNESIDTTPEIILDYQSRYKYLKGVKEPRQGLSYARNRTLNKAKGEWIVYLDDDAKLRPGYLAVLKQTINDYKFDCFGGPYVAWFLFGTRKWLPKDFGNKKLIRPDSGLINASGDLLSGGNFAIRKSVLKAIGGFNVAFGMKGNLIGYGEEDVLQIKLLEQGYRIGFVPDLIIDHIVMPYKLTLSWHLRSAMAQGEAVEGLRQKRRSTGIKLLALGKSLIGLFIKRLPLVIWNLTSKKSYFWQNGFLDLLKPIYKAFGAFLYSERNKKEKP